MEKVVIDMSQLDANNPKQKHWLKAYPTDPALLAKLEAEREKQKPKGRTVRARRR